MILLFRCVNLSIYYTLVVLIINLVASTNDRINLLESNVCTVPPKRKIIT